MSDSDSGEPLVILECVFMIIQYT